ncbi:MAG: ATP-binding response regulator [Pseudobdellovibrionaceae bacterium]
MFLPSIHRNFPAHSTSKVFPKVSSRPKLRTTAPLNSVSPTRPTILFLGQDDRITSLVQKTLEPDMGVISSRSLQEALPVLESGHPDLVLCDLQDQLPRLLETFQVRHLAEIPFLLFTTTEDRQAKASLLTGRVTDLLMKPCEAEELSARIRGHLHNYLAKKALQVELRHHDRPLEQLIAELISRTKELNRINKLKDEFMAVLSHELRNPINVIAGFAEILKSGVDQPDLAREAAEAIYRNSQVQVKLITDLLDVSRGITGKLILDTKPMALSEVLNQVLPMVKDAAIKQGITLTVCADEHGDMIQGDGIRISQVFWNLLSNALKFTPNGGAVHVQIQRRERWIEFSVKDTGPGIDPKFLPYMFERFHQQDASITKKFGGLGLGLAISRHIVELHGGAVSAFSEGLGHGATFTVRFPALTN